MTIKKCLVLGAAALLTSATLHAQSIAEKSVKAVLGVAPNIQSFVTQAANSDMLEIQASKLVAMKNDSKDQAFADQMIKDHGETSAKLKGLVDSGKVKATVPPTLDLANQRKLDLLRSTSGEDFRVEYEHLQLAGHKDAVQLFERYGKSGDNADLKAFANDTLPVLRHHLEMATALDKQ
jgi:putative membrane protein